MHDHANIEADLRELPILKKLAFATSCCERLIPNYLAFVFTEEWGDFSKLRLTVDKLWAGMVDELLLNKLSNDSLEDIIALAPETEDFSTVFTSLAGDAVAAVVYTLQAYQNPSASLEKILLVSEVAINSVFDYLASVNDPHVDPHIEELSFEESIFALPLMLSELESQLKDISLLVNNELSSGLVSQLRSSSAQLGIQPIRRGLVKGSLD